MRATLAFLLPLAATASAIRFRAEPSFADGVTPTPIFEDVTDVPVATVVSSSSSAVVSTTAVDTSVASSTTAPTTSERRKNGKGRGKSDKTQAVVVVTETQSVFTTFYRTVTANRPSSAAASSAAATDIATSFTTPVLGPGATGINPSFSSGETPAPIFVPVTDAMPSVISSTTTAATRAASSSAPASGLPADIAVPFTTPNLSPGATGIDPSFADGETPEPILVPVTDVPTSVVATASAVPTTAAVASSPPNKLEVTPTALPSGVTIGVDPTFAAGVTPTPILVAVTETASGTLLGPDHATTSAVSSASTSTEAASAPLGTGATRIDPTFSAGETPTPIFVPVEGEPTPIPSASASTLVSSATTTSIPATTNVASVPLGTGATGINPTFAAGETPTPILVPVDSEPTSVAGSATATLPAAALPTAPNGTKCNLPREKRDAHRERRERRAAKRERKARRTVKRAAQAARAAKRAVLQELNAIHFG